MGARLRGVAVVAVVLAMGAFLGSTLGQWWPRDGRVSAGQGPEAATVVVRAPAGRRVRVEVLNGGGLVGMAQAATDHLRDRGFDVVYYGNAATFGHDSSVVLDRVGEADLARLVADALGIRTVRAEPDSNLYLEATVVLGADWVPPAPPARTVADEADDAPWWDVRRWFRRDDATPAPTGPDPGSGARLVDPVEEREQR